MITYDPWGPGDPIIMKTNGVIDNSDFIVSESSGMDIEIGLGEAYIYGDIEFTGSPAILQVENNASGLTRYDLVILRADRINGVAELDILTGELDPTQTDGLWELPLAYISVEDNATEITNSDIHNLRVISNDYTHKLLCNLTNSTDTVIPAGAEVALPWDSVVLDAYLFSQVSTYIRPRVGAWYNVETEFKWTPDDTTYAPICFKVYVASNENGLRTTEVYNISSSYALGNTFSFNQNVLLEQGDYMYVTVKNTSTVDITVNTEMGVSPFFKLNFTTYPIGNF
jgi:hypothetical protein